MREGAIVAALVAALCAAPVGAQVSARQAEPQEVIDAGKRPDPPPDIEVPSPMLLELAVARPDGSSELQGVDVERGQERLAWATAETQRYVCDKAKVTGARIVQTRPATKRSPPRFEVSATLRSGWYRQDVNVTLTLATAAGEQLVKHRVTDLTIGNNSGGPFSGGLQIVRAPFSPSAGQHVSLLAEREPLRLSILVEINDD